MSALKELMLLDRDRNAARQSADQICSLLRDFIPARCYREAWELIAEACLKEGMEFTTKQMRKEYEAWKDLQITMLGTPPSQ